MTDGVYRTGQAARLLGVSNHHVRRLCEAGMVAAEMVDGRWRISASETERLKRDGIPPIPQVDRPSSPGAAVAAAGAARAVSRIILDDHEELAAERGGDRAQFSAEVQAEADSVLVAHNRLRRRKLELETEEVEDSFRDREKRRLAEEEEQRRHEVDAQNAARRKRWADRWLKVALRMVPFDAPQDAQLKVYAEVENTLRTLSPDDSESIVQQLVEASAHKALAPFRRRRQAQAAIDEALREMPWQLQQNAQCKANAQQRAAEAIRKAGDFEHCDLLVAARAAVAPVIAAGMHAITKAALVDDWAWNGYFDATQADRERAKAAIREALEDVGVGTAPEQMRKIRDKAVEPIAAQIRARKEKQQARQRAEGEVAGRLYHVLAYLRDNYDFEDGLELFITTES